MSDINEIPTPSYERTLHRARQFLQEQRIESAQQFRRSLIVGANAIQTFRMIENLSQVVDRKKAEQAVDAHELEQDLEQITTYFREAITQYDEQAILQAEGRVEKLTLSHDPFYLEEEENRKRKYFEEKKKKKARGPKATWTSNPSSRLISLFKGDLEGVEQVTPEEQRSCIAKCAWGFAIIGLIVAISFLIADFWSAQANPAVSATLKTYDELTLPVVYACLTVPMIPTFENLPRDVFKGFALWGLRSYTNADTEDTLMYPKTNLIVEEIFLGREDYCRQAMQYLSKEAILRALKSNFDPNRKCYSCLKIGGKAPITLKREDAAKRARGAVTLEFASAADIDYCFNPLMAANTIRRNAMRRTLKEHGQNLLDSGIVTLIKAPSLDFAFDHGFEDYYIAFPDDDIPGIAAEASVLCNLYFFSGLFFPVKPGTETHYSYDIDGGLESWKELGNKSNFLQVEPYTEPKPTMNVREAVFAEIREDDMESDKLPLMHTSVNVYAVNSADQQLHAYRDFAASLRQFHQDVLLFTKSVDNGEPRFSSFLQLGPSKLFKAIGRFNRFNISLDFATYQTEIRTRRPTTSTAEFLTDIFEYVGLFTGVCAYSVLVGPARMYLKSTNKRNRNSNVGSRM